MSYSLLLYGATGFSGRLIAAEGKRMGMSRHGTGAMGRMILAGRDGSALRRVADENGMEFRVFALDDLRLVRRSLDGVDVIINAAGPFETTAEPLACATLEAGCHYVDINGELDVYARLSRFASMAADRQVAIICGAGASAAASDVLLDLALKNIRNDPEATRLGSVRIAMSKVASLSRGSMLTAARSLRDRVVVVRASMDTNEMMVCYEPVGRLERTFDFGPLQRDIGGATSDLPPRVASAVGLIDTLVAMHTAKRHHRTASSIESYVLMGAVGRFAYQVSGMLSSFARLPAMRTLAEAQLNLLPEGPGQQELESERHVIVLEIEDAFRTRLVDWRMETPSVYQLTAQLAVGTANAIARLARGDKVGWVTPADALGPVLVGADVLRGCTLTRRRG